MNKTALKSKKIPVFGPYSPAIEAGGLVFISGQLPVEPVSNQTLTEISEATRQALHNLRTLLEENGLSLDDVVKTTIYLTDIGQAGVVNHLYTAFFQGGPPARSTVGVAALPKGAPIEIEAIAVRS